MNAEFVEQVKIHVLMHLQHIKQTQKHSRIEQGNYKWLSERRPTISWMSNRDEYLIRQELKKLKEDEKIKVINQLLKWIEEHPEISSGKIPELSLRLLNNAVQSEVIKNVTISRMASFRNSFRRGSILSNKIVPVNLELNVMPVSRQNRSVTFNDIPTIYSISE